MSNHGLKSLWSLLADWSNGSRRPRQRQSQQRNQLRFEALEDRRVLATLWVDPNVAPMASIFSSIADAVAAAHTGDTVKVVAGTYHEQVEVNKTLTLIGGQVRATGEPVGPSIVTPVNPGSDIAAFLLDASGITVKNFSIQQEAIGIVTNANFSGFNILHNTFLDDVAGVSLNTSFALTAKTTNIGRNLFSNDSQGLPSQNGILSHGGLRNVIASGNTFIAIAAGISIKIDGQNPSANVQIVNNRFLNSGGIALANTTSAKIDGNWIESPLTGAIDLAGAVTNSEVANNTIYSSSMSLVPFGIRLNEDFGLGDAHDKIGGNTIRGFSEGISLTGVSHTMIVNNTLSLAAGFEIDTHADCVSNTISSNSVTSSGGSGILIANSDGNIITKNIASANAVNGIYLADASGNTLSGNVATFNGRDGIFLESVPTTKLNILKGNTASSNSMDGIALQDSDQNKLTGNTAKLNGNAGFNLTASQNNTLSRNTANLNLYGFVSDTSQQNTFFGNTASSNVEVGFQSSGNTNTFTRNSANNNGASGFSVQGNANVINMNTAKGNAADGIALMFGGSNNLVKGNTVSGNLLNGLELDGGSGNTISGNIVKDNQADGMMFSQATGNTISANLVMDNDLDGIHLDLNSSSNTISGSTAMGNGAAIGGFDLFDASMGGGTAGTANTWAGNKALTRSPAGLL